MAFSAEKLLAHQFPEIRHTYVERDTILYALGIGLGADPVDPADLGFLYENGLNALPTMAVTLSSPGMWLNNPALEIDWVKGLHAAQSARFETPLPPKASVIGQARIASVLDRGAGRGAEVVVERRIVDVATGQTYCVLEQTILLRGNGGFAAEPAPRAPKPVLPARAPDLAVSFETSPRAALIYRLSGDWNLIHVDPTVARKAGFEKPILHGLASYGIAGWVILKALAGGDPTRMKALALRFASPVIPGERLDFELWQEGGTVLFQAKAGERVVLDQGRAMLA